MLNPTPNTRRIHNTAIKLSKHVALHSFCGGEAAQTPPEHASTDRLLFHLTLNRNPKTNDGRQLRL